MGSRLPPGEAARRAKERAARLWSGESHAKYNPTIEGYGSEAEWIAAAEALCGGYGTFKRPPGVKTDSVRTPNMIIIMGLAEMPADIAGLKKAFRNACFVHHPDHGGTDKAMRDLLTAFEKLSKSYA